MSTTYLQLSIGIWGFLLATILGLAIHTVTTHRRDRAFTNHTVDALALLSECWPEPEVDDDVTRCGACGILWAAHRVCPRREVAQ